ncbi:MAG: hypothetical protein HOH74_18685, partial [Gemmatimonadetes bacterium]|nr:hypothetical protein [Gemmatimonadota bacterium]
MPDLYSGNARRPSKVRGTTAWALCILLLSIVLQPADGAVPTRFHQDQATPPIPGLVGTNITDVVWSGRYLWVSTERGLARLDPLIGEGLSPEDWVTFTEANGLGRGSVSALAASGDTVWAATLFDSLGTGQDRPPPVGSGLSWSTDGGSSWDHITNEALFDTLRPGFSEGPFTSVQNPCFGLSLDGDTIWAAFWSGSTIRSTDFGRTWERVLPGGGERIVFTPENVAADLGLLQFSLDSLQSAGADPAEIAQVQAAADSVANLFLLHRTFAVAAWGDTVWVGTAFGVTSSTDLGQSWTHHRVRMNGFGEPLPGNLSANWGLAIEREITADGRSLVWVGASVTEGTGQVAAMNVTDDGGTSWQATGPTFAWDFAFTGGDTIWAGSDAGLLVTPNRGTDWFLAEVEDPFTRDILLPSFVGVERFTLPDGRVALWAGADNGLGRSVDGGLTWTILSFPIKTPALDTGEVIGAGGLVDLDGVLTYAAPSPFAPSQGQRCRFVYSLAKDARVTIEIYDVASRRVRTLVDGVDRAGDRNHGENWDGLNDDGQQVANGVYLFRVETDAGD